jgi:hypothetical protein
VEKIAKLQKEINEIEAMLCKAVPESKNKIDEIMAKSRAGIAKLQKEINEIEASSRMTIVEFEI